MKKIIVFGIILSTVFMLSFAAEKKEVRYVNVQQSELKEKASNFGKTVQSLEYAQPVTLIEDNGKWAKISLENGTQGYVNSASLTKRKIRSSGFSASASELALAGKGFNVEIENTYKQSGNVDFDSVDDMESFRIKNNELLSFLKEGNLNEGAGE